MAEIRSKEKERDRNLKIGCERVAARLQREIDKLQKEIDCLKSQENELQ